jgi:hypothetical protein
MVCPSAHCPNCGSTDIKYYIEKEASAVDYLLVFLMLFISVFLWIFEGTPIVGLLSIVLLLIVLILYARVHKWGKWCCNTCGARFRSPIRNVPLRSEETISDMIRSEIEKIKDFMEELES